MFHLRETQRFDDASVNVSVNIVTYNGVVDAFDAGDGSASDPPSEGYKPLFPRLWHKVVSGLQAYDAFGLSYLSLLAYYNKVITNTLGLLPPGAREIERRSVSPSRFQPRR